jgi:hypothetical protein
MNTMNLNQKLQGYFAARVFNSEEKLDEFLTSSRIFRYTKHLYFDEVENANVWSFSLVDQDLHHTFEEYIINSGLPPYAIWSRPDREDIKDDLGRATFPISEIATMYRPPVPKAGDELNYIIEVLSLDEGSAVLGFLGFLVPLTGKRSLKPSLASAWLRVFVNYKGDDRYIATIPIKFHKVLQNSLAKDFRW